MKRQLAYLLAAALLAASTEPTMAQTNAPEAKPAETGTLDVTVLDGDGEAPVACRAWVDAGGRRYFEPAGKAHTPYRRDRSFACEGRFRIRLPAGAATLHVERGKEYLPVDRAVRVAADQTARVTVTLDRWVNMPDEGFYSCDVHMHLDYRHTAHARRLALADDVHVLPILTYWHHGGSVPKSWPAAMGGPTLPADATHLVSLASQEIERIRGGRFCSIGAPLMMNLSRPVSAALAPAWPTNAALCRQARRHSPDCLIDLDKPIWGENVVGVALGLFDTAQLCHNHYHRERDLATHGGMAGFLADGEARLGRRELFERTNAVYYRWLNCGFRLPVTGGSAYGVMPVPVGYNRTYARITGKLTVASFCRAVRAGRTFATSGPMLTMAADGKPLGTVLKRAAGEKPVEVAVRVRAIEKLDALQLVQDGRVVRELDLSGEKPAAAIDRSVTWRIRPKRSGWIAARAVYRNAARLRRQAHTSPVYLLLDGRPVARKADAEYMLRWIDRLVEIANRPDRFTTDPRRQEVLKTYRQARAVYEKVIRTAAETWGD